MRSLTPRTNNDKRAFGRFLFAPLSLPHQPSPSSPHPRPQTTRNNLPRCPSPLMRDLGPVKTPQLPSEARSHRSRPSPFQRDVGGLLLFEGDWRNEKHQGGPMKWEAHEVRPEIRATTFVMARFPQFLIPSHPTDHHYAQRQRIERRHDWRLPRTRRYEPNEGAGSRATR